jgi:8-oxo-dGTP diphosphatase
LILDVEDRVLLCRWDFADGAVWGTPGGGIESGESHLAALRRELIEEVGLRLDPPDMLPPHLWHQRVVAAGHASGYDGVVNDIYLVRTAAFDPAGSLSPEELAAENLVALRWWTVDELSSYDGPDLFAPRDMADLVAEVVRSGVPPSARAVGL